MMVPYVQKIQGSAMERIREEVKEYLANKDLVKMDDLEKQLVAEAETLDERNELHSKIMRAKVKRVEKIAEKIE